MFSYDMSWIIKSQPQERKCPVCKGSIDVIPINDLGFDQFLFMAQCENKCYNVRIIDNNSNDAVSKCIATIKYLEQ